LLMEGRIQWCDSFSNFQLLQGRPSRPIRPQTEMFCLSFSLLAINWRPSKSCAELFPYLHRYTWINACFTVKRLYIKRKFVFLRLKVDQMNSMPVRYLVFRVPCAQPQSFTKNFINLTQAQDVVAVIDDDLKIFQTLKALCACVHFRVRCRQVNFSVLLFCLENTEKFVLQF
jgi:hypothetical protein